MSERQEQWEARYASVDRLWSGEPNDWLPELAAGWAPGTALDIGCGEGDDALWLAARGWEVTGADLSPTAVGRLRDGARRAGLGGRVRGRGGLVRLVRGGLGGAGGRGPGVVRLLRAPGHLAWGRGGVAAGPGVGFTGGSHDGESRMSRQQVGRGRARGALPRPLRGNGRGIHGPVEAGARS